MTWLKKAWAWVKTNATALLGVLVALAAAVFYAGRARRKQLDAEAQAAVDRARVEIVELEAAKKSLMSRVDARESDVRDIDKAIAENKRAVVAAHREVENLSGEDIENAFRDLGY